MKINNLLYCLSIGAALALGVTSCNNDDFLTVDHYTILDEDSGYDTDDHVLRSLIGCYDSMMPGEDVSQNADPFKPYIFTGSHPTMDTQATGWDKDFMTQSWTAEKSELLDGWSAAYNGITRCNDFLQNLEDYAENFSSAVYTTCKGEALVIRAFHYFWLATTFGRVPLLVTGETYVNTPYKAKADTYEEMWNFIIDDLETASELLSYKPYNSQYGRCTKGMALAYLGDAYMWKAYRCPDQATSCYQKAESALKQVLDCGEYSLADSFTTLWDADSVWNPETIYVQVMDEGNMWGSWDSNLMSGAHGWTSYYSASPANGGWGTIAMSWELYDCFEAGDLRRDGSLVTAAIPWTTTGGSWGDADFLPGLDGNYTDFDGNSYPNVHESWKSTITVPDAWINANNRSTYPASNYVPSQFNPISDDPSVIASSYPNLDFSPDTVALYTTNGFDPFVQEYVNVNTFHLDTGGEYAPAVYTTKFWRLGRCHWQNDQWTPGLIYRKRLPNVMLDYAECRFNLYGANDAEAWAQINTLRQRAFGEMTSAEPAFGYFTQIGTYYSGSYQDGGFGNYVAPTSYPCPTLSTTSAPDAQTYYTQYASEKGFSSPVWKVALNTERRKEFSCEWCLCPDLLKSEFMEDHIATNYPMHSVPGTAGTDEYAYNCLRDWQSIREFTYDPNKMDMPIPSDELIKNPLLTQNDAYITGN